jgi:MoaA/NifB/PqqE/SkfB family radical SAM enzyme
MGFVVRTRRHLYFAGYHLRPFRQGLALRHALKRLLSAIRPGAGYRVIDLALTYECNLSCRHCSAATLIENSESCLSMNDYRQIVSQGERMDVMSYNITGGEPLLSPLLFELIEVLKPIRHYVSVQTNGMLLDHEMTLRLASAGVNCITTSLDSPDSSEHDSFRGSEGSFGKVLMGVQNARNAGMQVLIAGTVTHQNLRSPRLLELIELTNTMGAIFLFNLAAPCGRWQGQEAMLLQPGDREYLNALLEYYPRTATDHEVGRNRKGCPAGIEKCYITAGGDVLPCPFIHLSFGNVKRESLVRIVQRMRGCRYFGSYQPVCIAAEDPDFRSEVMERIAALQTNGPVPYTQVPGLAQGR